MFASIATASAAAAAYEYSRRKVLGLFTPTVYSAENPTLGLETVATYMLHLTTLRTKEQFCTAALVFTSHYYGGNAWGKCKELISELAAMPDLSVQAGERDDRDVGAELLELLSGSYEPLSMMLDPQAGDWEAFRSKFAFGVDCFKSVRHANFYKHARKIVATIMAGSLFADKLQKDHPWFHKRLYEGVDKNNSDPVELFDEVLDLMREITDALTYCVQTGSVDPLLGRALNTGRIDVEHAYLKAHFDAFMDGSLERVTREESLLGPHYKVVTNEEFSTRLVTFEQDVLRLHKGMVGVEKTLVQRKLVDARAWVSQLAQKLSQRGLRQAPFVVGLVGPTAGGKSTAAMNILRHMLQANGFPHASVNLAQINTASKFYDTVTNKTQGCNVDDFCNTLPQFRQVDELNQLIQLCNNANVPVTKAAVEEKGNVFFDVKCVVVSTNNPDLSARITQCEPSASLRRINVWGRTRVDPKYSRTFDNTTVQGLGGKKTLDMLDYSKLDHGFQTQFQLFDVITWVPSARTESRDFKDEGDFHVVIHNGKPMRDLRYGEFMRYIKEVSQAYFANQRGLLLAFAQDEALPLCPHGATTAPFCELCTPSLCTPRQEALHFESAPLPREEDMETQAGDLGERIMRAGDEAVSALFGRDMSVEVRESAPPPSPVSSVSTAEPEPEFEVAPNRWENFKADCVSLYRRATIAPAPAERPTLLTYAKAWLGGPFEIEDYAITHFDGVMLALFSVGPLIATICSSFLALIGLEAFICSFAWIGIFGFSTISLTRNARGWISARVAGAALSDLKARSLEMARASLGLVGTIMGVLVVAHGLRKAFTPRPKVPKVDPESQKLASASSLATESTDEFAIQYSDQEYENQGGCASASVPDPVPKVNQWERREVATFHRPKGPILNMTPEQIRGRIDNMLYIMEIEYASGNTVVSNCLIVATNYAVAPAHNFLTPDGDYAKVVSVKFRTTTASFGPIFTWKPIPQLLLRLPGDAMLMQINAGGTMPDNLQFFSEAVPGVCFPAVEHYRDPSDCKVRQLSYLVKPGNAHCTSYSWFYRGFEYVRPEKTFKGLCGAAITTSARFPQIVGMHTMGLKEGHHGAAVQLARSDIEAGIGELRKTGFVRSPVIVSEDTVPFTPLGMEEMGEVGALVPGSVLREDLVGTPIIKIGTLVNHKGVRPKTRLMVSPFSKVIERCCDEPRKHEPPQNIGKATVEVAKLKEIGDRGMWPAEDFALALQDTRDELFALGRSMDVRPLLRVLTIEEAVSGIPGAATVKAINAATAAGFPRLGNKRALLLAAPRDGLPDGFTLTDEVRADVERAMEKMANLRRPNFVFKGCHKDEAVKIGKLKTRVFEASPIEFTIIMRMLFLPVIRVFLLARLETGSAVGIDASGGEWDEHTRWLQAYNRLHAIVGDWPHFDTSHHYWELMSVFSLWTEFAEEFGDRTEEQLNIMWGCGEETARHYALLRSDLAIMEGSNPSGGIATVYANNPIGENRLKSSFYGLAREQGVIECPELWDPTENRHTSGGLHLHTNGRAGFKPLLPNLRGRFKDYVRGAYYGDDFELAAREHIMPWYNQMTIGRYFNSVGVNITDAGKKPFEREATPWEEVTFLKRYHRFDAELDKIVGPLEMGSIYKPFHTIPPMRDCSIEEHYAQLFDSALRELVLHGREVYEERAPKLLDAAVECNSRFFMRTADVSYEGMRDAWKAKEVSRLVDFAAGSE